jgi:EpsI family protein
MTHSMPRDTGVLVRAALVAACLLAGAGIIAHASKSERVPPREPLATFPMQIGAWEGQSSDRFDQRVLTVLGVDEYVNRVYTAAGRNAVGLYVGYYNSQRQGDTMHSPLNCLPGAGWEPVSHERIALNVWGRASAQPPVTVNRVLIQKGLDRQVVVYWYQSHGRVVASEYWGKIYTVLDAIRLNRTDAAMIRVISPVAGGDDAATAAASRAATDFVQAIFPLLGRYLPE